MRFISSVRRHRIKAAAVKGRLGAGAIPTGIAVAPPAASEGQIRPRSGLAARNGVTVLNTPGTIDADYRGELQVILINTGAELFVVSRGTRIAQLVIAPIQHAKLVELNSLDATERASGGLGSTGLGSKTG